jgi:hypothetical protein
MQIFTRIIRFISESNDKEEKKIGLMSLTSIAGKMQGTARSIFVNKFHSPIFKLIETNSEESLVPYVEKAYEVVMEIGGNRNDAAIESNLGSCLCILESPGSKDIRKIGVYSILKVLVRTSPYITFKKFLQKHKNTHFDNLYTVINASRVKNIRIRNAYLQFLREYIRYIAEKKDRKWPPTQTASRKPPPRGCSTTSPSPPGTPPRNSTTSTSKPSTSSSSSWAIASPPTAPSRCSSTASKRYRPTEVLSLLSRSGHRA